MHKYNHKKGIALISVLFIAVVLMILTAIFSSVITSERQSTTANKLVDVGVQVSDGISERARVQIIGEYHASGLTNEVFLTQLRDGSYENLKKSTVYSATLGDYTSKWKILGVSEAGAAHKWLDIAVTTETAKGAQTIVKRIGFGTSNIFELAMLSENTNCMYCHIRVNGDVGSLNELAPGWSSANSGKTSRVNGTAYIAPKSDGSNGFRDDGDGSTSIDGDPNTTDTINGAEFDNVEVNYAGDKLPQDEDGDGIPDFPPLKREVMEANAFGQLSGGTMYGVPSGSTSIASLTSATSLSLVNGKYDGNLILIGTEANPINLDEDIYATGDIIIQGHVTGTGALYSGRNIYVAGDLIAVDPPDKLGAGVCSAITDPDECAKKNIAAGKDEIRLGSRGNIILGDYTNENNTWRDKAAQDFNRSQFGFNGSTTRYYDVNNGDELFKTADGKYKNVDGTIVSSNSIAKKPGIPAYDAYDHSFKPGLVKKNGEFEGWMTDDLYRSILGTEDRGYDMWRTNVDMSQYASEADVLAELKVQLAGANASEASLLEMATAMFTGANVRIDLKDDLGNSVAEFQVNGGNINGVVDTVQTLTKQTKKVDAFLYANQRIAGKANNAPMAINGGMIAKEIGVLAPGVLDDARIGGFKPQNSRYDALKNMNCKDQSSAALIGDAAYEADADDCSLTVNYDHRMRNGGYGYNLISAKLGQTIGWKLADTREERVE